MDQFQDITIPLATRGVNTDDPPEKLSQQSPKVLNMFVGSSTVVKRPGLSQLGVDSLPLTGVGKKLVRFVDARGNLHFFALTSTNAYEYNFTTDAWDDVTPVADDFAGSINDNWTFAVVQDAATFATNGGTALIINNGVDGPYQHQGVAMEKFTLLNIAGFATLASAKVVAQFWNSFFIFNYNNTNNNIRCLAHTGFGSAVDWTSETAAINVLTDTTGAILNAVRLGYDLVIYSEKSITIGIYVGGTTFFTYPTIVDDIGIFGQQAIVSLGDSHLLLGSDSRIYQVKSGRTLEWAGTGIEDGLFTAINCAYKKLIHGLKDSPRKKAWIFYPAGSDAYPYEAIVYNYKPGKESWEFHDFGLLKVMSAELFSVVTSAYFDDAKFAGVYADEVSGYADDFAQQAGSEIVALLTADGYVYQMDNTVREDDGAPFTCIYETPDIEMEGGEYKFRTSAFSFTAMSMVADSVLRLYYSEDHGKTWIPIANTITGVVSYNFALSSDWSIIDVPLDVKVRRIRIRIIQDTAGSDLQLRDSMNLRVQPTGEHS